MIVQLTRHCNFRCPHCLVDASPDSSEFMTEKTLTDVIRFINNSNSKFLGVSGGEPTTHPEFLHFMERILREVDCNVALMTNGNFLFHSEIRDGLIDLLNIRSVYVQVSAVKGLYPKVMATKKMFKKYQKRMPNSMLIEELTIMESMGRAKGEDYLFSYGGYQKQAPSCFNLFSASRHKEFKGYELDDFAGAIDLLHNTTKGNFCKPLIDSYGQLFAGESNTCLNIGSVTDSMEQIWNNYKAGKPCGGCGVISSVEL